MASKDLTEREREFCRQYIVDLNQTQAAVRTGYAAKSASVHGARLFAKDSVQAEIQRLMAKRSAKVEITADEVLGELKLLGMAKMSKFTKVDKGGNLVSDFSRCTERDIDSITEVFVETITDLRGETRVKTKIKLDKVAPLTQLGRHLGLWNDKLEVTPNLKDLSVEELEILASLRQRMSASE